MFMFALMNCVRVECADAFFFPTLWGIFSWVLVRELGIRTQDLLSETK
jgi:hypothetical protein